MGHAEEQDIAPRGASNPMGKTMDDDLGGPVREARGRSRRLLAGRPFSRRDFPRNRARNVGSVVPDYGVIVAVKIRTNRRI